MTTLDTLCKEAEQLPLDQRVALAHRMLASADPHTNVTIDQVWDDEIRARIKRFDEGTTKAIPAAEVFGKADALLSHES